MTCAESYAHCRSRAWLTGTAAIMLCAATTAGAIDIEFDYRFDTGGLFTDVASGAPVVARRALLETAASFYSGFGDTLSAISPRAGDSWSVQFTHPSLAGPTVTLGDEPIPAGTLRVFVGGSRSAPGVLGFANTGFDLRATGSADFVDAVFDRGQAATAGPAAGDYATWGGMAWFNSAHDWYFGAQAPDPGSERPDFLTTATHEIGHILGFGEADSWHALIDAEGRFTGARSIAQAGGSIPLDRFHSHWAEGTMSERGGVLQETLMDPTTPRGARELPTALDYAAFADIGWQVSPVPEPRIAVLLAFGSALVGWWIRRRPAGG